MQAVILAAGSGTRLQPMTNDLPKPMVKVAGRPILERTLNVLPDEVEEVIVIVGYKKEKVINHFGDEYRHMSITYVEQDEPKGTFDALERAKGHLRPGLFLHLHGDDLYHPYDLQRLVNSHKPSVLVAHTDHPENYGICIPDEDNYLTKIIEKSKDAPGNLANIGAYLLHTDFFNVEKFESDAVRGEYVTAELLGEWAKTEKIKLIQATFWYTVTKPEDVYIADKFLGM